jgi:HD-GYP domain-containing protein (c-di-GMP phosphodiesterase class II)
MDLFLQKIVSVYASINRGTTIEDTLDFVFANFQDDLPYTRIGLALLDFHGSIYSLSVRAGSNSDIGAGFVKNLQDTSLQSIVASGQPRIIGDYAAYLREHPRSDTTQRLLREGILSSLACPLMLEGAGTGVLFFSSTRANAFGREHIPYATMLADNFANAVDKLLFNDDLILASITGLARLVEAKDSDTGAHIERMQSYSRLIAQSISSTQKHQAMADYLFCENIYKFSALHDIGKVGIADGILLKPARLTPEEFGVMKTHTTIGADILSRANTSMTRAERHFFDMGIEVALGHHERYNGSGYPQGLSGENIPLSARIVIIADVLDALTSKRVYKDAFSIADALQYIRDERSRMFDPFLVDAMMEREDEVLSIYKKHHEGIDLNNI